MIDTSFLHWAAGFIDGEGSFSSTANSPSVNAAQKDPELLLRLQAAFGGQIYQQTDPRGKGYTWHIWHLGSGHAVGLAMTLYPLLSHRRRHAIVRMLKKWKRQQARPRPDRVWGEPRRRCLRGHDWIKQNLYIWRDRPARCRVCSTENDRKYREQKKLRLVQGGA
jgi:hypothetical protein